MSGSRTIKVKQVIEVVEADDVPLVADTVEQTPAVIEHAHKLSLRKIAILTTVITVVATTLYVLL